MKNTLALALLAIFASSALAQTFVSDTGNTTIVQQDGAGTAFVFGSQSPAAEVPLPPIPLDPVTPTTVVTPRGIDSIYTPDGSGGFSVFHP